MSIKNLFERERTPYYKAISEHIGGALGRNTAEAVADLYSIYSEDVILWLSRLYDGKTGAFYYSPSARYNEFVEFRGREVPLGVDVESTCQALVLVSRSLRAGDSVPTKSVYPDRIYRRTADFIKSLQHENGFFYHPQWGKEWIDSQTNRRARDLYWCSSFLREIGERPKYDTPDGLRGEWRSSAPTEAAKPKSKAEVPEHLIDREHFIKYLSGFDMKKTSYHSGNEITTQTGIILERDRVLRAEGKDYSLMDILCDWMSETLNPETGHWESEDSYYGVSGFLKAGSMYSDARRIMPYPEASARSAIRAVLSNEPVTSITDIFNTWYAISMILGNLRLFGGNSGNRRAEALIAEIIEKAPEMIEKTKAKLSVFSKPGCSFSYLPDCSSPTSQDMPVAIRGAREGDINATGIAINGTRERMLMSMGIDSLTPPLFTAVEKNIFVDLLDARLRGEHYE